MPYLLLDFILFEQDFLCLQLGRGVLQVISSPYVPRLAHMRHSLLEVGKFRNYFMPFILAR